jgi:hypothetical protein
MSPATLSRAGARGYGLHFAGVGIRAAVDGTRRGHVLPTSVAREARVLSPLMAASTRNNRVAETFQTRNFVPARRHKKHPATATISWT